MAYTTTASVDYAQTAYDRLAYFAYRPELYYDRAVEVKPTRQSMPGATVVFTIQNDLPIASTALNESTDLTPVAMSDSQVSVALAEYGNVTVTTAKLRGEAFVEIDPIQANVVGYNAAVSIDEVAKLIAQAGTTVDYAQGSQTVAPDLAGLDHARWTPSPQRTSGWRRHACAGPTSRPSVAPTWPTSTPTCPMTSRARPGPTPGPTRTRTPSPTRSGRARSACSKGSASSRPHGPRGSATPARLRPRPRSTGPCSWAARRCARRTRSWTATGTTPTSSPVP